MKNRILTLCFLYLALIISPSLYSQQLPNLRKVNVHAEITVNSSAKLYYYNYTLTSDGINSGNVIRFEIDITRDLNSIMIDTLELRFEDNFTETSFRRHFPALREKIVPVGFPNSPEIWDGGITNNLTARFSGSELLIKPGETLSGFTLMSKGLPGIRPCIVSPDFDIDILYPMNPDTPDTAYSFKQIDLDREAVKFRGLTIGPTAPPANFVHLDFLDTIISYKHQARDLGWIDNQGTADKYEDHFTSAQTNLQQGNINGARVSLNTVLTEVALDSATSLTSEAYALLRYNTEYLLNQLPEQSSIAVLATHSIWLEQNSEILSGSVVVNESGDPPFLDSQVALSVGIGSSIAAGYDLKANSIKVKQNATVACNVHYNELSNNSTITGSLTTPLSLPVLPTLPPFQTGAPGGENITLAQNEERTLAPGDYGDVVVKMGGKVIFTGGIYNLRSLNSGDNTHLVFRAASQVRTAEKFETGQGAFIGPETGAAIRARDIVLYVAGINGPNGNLGATPKAAKVGLSNTVFANFYVPNGTLWLRQGSVVEGVFIGKDVDVGIGVKVSLNSAW